MKEVVLIVIYNHRYDKNIEKIERIYGGRFSSIFHLVPFYDGTKSNVIAVYENSRQFQGYVAQGISDYFNDEAKHYFFIGDDLILNPLINENNYTEFFKIDSKSSFIPSLIELHKCETFWPRVQDAYYFKFEMGGVEVENEFPTYQQALARFKLHKLEMGKFPFFQIYRKPKQIDSIRRLMDYFIWCYRKVRYGGRKFEMKYPLVGAYADIFIVSSDSLKLFAKYCGGFAATRLFVEVALPSALVLSSNQIVTEKNTKLKGRALWTKEEMKILDPYNNNLKELYTSFPPEYLYLHPVKLSKWNIEEI